MVNALETKWRERLENKGRVRTGLKLTLEQTRDMKLKDRLSVRSLYRTEVAIRAIKQYMENRPEQKSE